MLVHKTAGVRRRRRSFALPLPSPGMETVVVTGATGAIGEAVTEAFAAQGARVVLGGRDGEELSRQAANVDGQSTAIRTDVRDEFDVERLLERAARVGESGVDIVVPCAAVAHGNMGEAPLHEASYAAFDDTIQTNVRGVFATVREATPYLSPESRVLIPTGSVSTGINAGYGVYAVSKAAVEGIMRGFAADLDCVVGCVDPGVVASDLTDQKGRDPSEIADLFTWAASVDADVLNGETLGLREWRRSQGE